MTDEKSLAKVQRIENDIEVVNNFQSNEEDEPDHKVLDNSAPLDDIGQIDENDIGHSLDYK